MPQISVQAHTAGDFLERYSANLDIITAAAARVSEQLAQQLRSEVTA